jgi:hypothetical protein
MSFNRDFKDAIKAMPVAAKDRLLLRLIKTMPGPEMDMLLLRLLKQDLQLADRLYDELLGHNKVETIRDDMEHQVVILAQRAIYTYRSPTFLRLELRDISSQIAGKVKVANDRFGAVYLNLCLLVLVLEGTAARLADEPMVRTLRLNVYVVAKAFDLVALAQQLPPDQLLGLRPYMLRLSDLIGGNERLMRTAIYHGFDVNWLSSGHIPVDIADKQRQLRQNGYLK